MQPRIFISYRRADAPGDAGRLSDHVQRRFGADRVFLDIDTIDPGADFVKVLRRALAETAVMLVVIGPHWTSLRAQDGSRRLDAAGDFVRMEVEAALARDIPVVPVLVQGARMPQEAELPPSLAGLSTRQAFALDHAEFRDDAERLCDRIARMIGPDETKRSPGARWWPAAAVVAAAIVALAAYLAMNRGDDPRSARPIEDAQVRTILDEATVQRRRNEYGAALTTLEKARALAPASADVRGMREEIAMEWIRDARVESGKGTFREAIAPALAVVDEALPAAAGARRADLLAHSGWAAFLMWRDGDRRQDPAGWYRDALSADAGNPYANAMLAHWLLFQDDELAEAVKLFDTAASAGRALDVVRVLQWAAYTNDSSPEADVQLVRLADTMRRGGETLTATQVQKLWPPYYYAVTPSREKERALLLDALSPDDHIATLRWAFGDSATQDESRRLAVRYYVALLHAKAGRLPEAQQELRAIRGEPDASPALQAAADASLRQLQPAAAR